MYDKWLKAVIFFVLTNFQTTAQKSFKPFPQHINYYRGGIKPNNIPQSRLDQLTLSFYDQWREHYIKPGCHPDEYYVWFERSGNKQCVSEGQGYGMIITVLMAGADQSAKTLYDGLYHYYKAH